MLRINNILTVLNMCDSEYSEVEFQKIEIVTNHESYHIVNLGMHAPFIYKAIQVNILTKQGEKISISGKITVYNSSKQCILINAP